MYFGEFFSYHIVQCLESAAVILHIPKLLEPIQSLSCCLLFFDRCVALLDQVHKLVECGMALVVLMKEVRALIHHTNASPSSKATANAARAAGSWFCAASKFISSEKSHVSTFVSLPTAPLNLFGLGGRKEGGGWNWGGATCAGAAWAG